MLDLNKNFVDEVYDENGHVVDYTLKCPENFNFAYDVVDAIAAAEPDKRALLWCNPAGEERIFTYGDLKYYSDKTANMLREKGIKKGDMVMVILKRHYQFWFTILALHKLGAVIIPATFMLQKHDIVYRANAATIKAVVCTGDGDIAEQVDEALPECPSIETRIIVNGKRDGWDDFMTDMEKADSLSERVDTKYYEPMIVYFSSGTTGNPKMAMHAHTYALAHLTTAKYWHDVTADSVHLTIADTGWGKAVWGKLYGEMFMESCVFVYDYDKFHASEILSILEKYKITSLCCPPTMFRFMLQEDVSSYDLSSLKYCTIAGEALNPDVFNKWYEETGIKLMEAAVRRRPPCLLQTASAWSRSRALWVSLCRTTMWISLTKTADRYLPVSPARLSFIPSRRFLLVCSRAITATRRRLPRRGTTVFIIRATPRGRMRTAIIGMSEEPTMS